MKLPCSVVRDLIPVYVENLVEQETRELIDQHLADCVQCRQILSETKEEPLPPIETAKPLQNLKKQIRKQRWRAVLIAALCVFIALFTYFIRADSMLFLPWTERLVQIKGIETVTPDQRIGRTYQILQESPEDCLAPQNYTGEALILRTDSTVVGTMSNMAVEEDGTTTVFLQALGRNSRSMNTRGTEGELVFYPVPDRVIYGYSGTQKLLWGDPLNGGGQVLPRLSLSYYLLIAAGLTVITGALWIMFRRKQWSWTIRQGFFLPVSYIVAHLLLMGFRTTTFFILRDFSSVVLTACALYALFSLLWQVWLQRKKSV